MSSTTEKDDAVYHLLDIKALCSQGLIGGEWATPNYGRTFPVGILGSLHFAECSSKGMLSCDVSLHGLIYLRCSVQVNNPATGQLIMDVPYMGGKETSAAIDAAYNAFHCKFLVFQAPGCRSPASLCILPSTPQCG